MPPRPKTIVERLGPDGLRRALGDALDGAQLVRLANACGLKYPGMRTQTQSRERLLGDLASRAGSDATTAKAVVRAIDKFAQPTLQAFGTLSRDELAARLTAESDDNGDGLGVRLYLLARGDADEALGATGAEVARRLLLRGPANGTAPSQPTPTAGRDELKLRKKVQSLEKKLRHLEGQLVKTKDQQKDAKRDLIQRKGELAECRMLTERLRGELREAQAVVERARKRDASAVSDKTVSQLATTVRRLAAEHGKLARAVDKAGASKPAPPSFDPKAIAAPLGEMAGDIARMLGEHRKKVRAELDDQAKRFEELRSDVAAELSAALSTKRPRARGKAQRVGVFIDVQNMYYSARKLKGKLDFDALIEAAVRDRRMIQATAYVVESKETDQSHFIAMLQERAIQVERKPLMVRADGSTKGDWDMELALDVLDAAPKLDVVVLVSGDGDFAPLVKRVKTIGPRVEVIAFARNAAKSLIEAADRFQPLDRKFMIYRRRTRRPDAARRPATAARGGPAKPKAGPPKDPTGKSGKPDP